MFTPLHLFCSSPPYSIIGPNLFLIFIIDLPDGINFQLVSYADDTTIIIRYYVKFSTDLQSDMQSVANRGSEWYLHLKPYNK